MGLARRMTFRRFVFGLIGTTLILVGIGFATRTPPGDVPVLSIAGSGFLFNYRIGEVRYGFSAKVMKPVRKYSIIEATFEDPAGGPPLHATQKLTPRTTRYALRSPPVRGVEKGHPYAVAVRLIQNGDGAVLFEDQFTVVSQLADTVVPPEPLTIGPGYTRNPRLPDGWKHDEADTAR